MKKCQRLDCFNESETTFGLCEFHYANPKPSMNKPSNQTFLRKLLKLILLKILKMKEIRISTLNEDIEAYTWESNL